MKNLTRDNALEKQALSAKIIQSWDRRAAAYQALTEHWPIFTHLATRLLGLLPSNASGKLLDLGGGSGLVAKLVSQRFPQLSVEILEPSAGMRRLASNLVGPTVRLHPYPAEEAFKTQGKFNFILCNAAFHLFDENKVFEGISQLMSPGALFCFNLWGHSFEETAGMEIKNPEQLYLKQAFKDLHLYFVEPKESTQARVRSLECLQTAARKAGFGLEKVRVDLDRISAAFFIDFCAMSPGWPQQVPAELRGKVIDRARQLAAEAMIGISSVAFVARRLAA